MSAEPEVVDADVVPEQAGTALATVPTLAVTPSVQASELVERLDVIRQAQTTAMVADVDYGVIPGTDKPTLYKPGAEKLSVLFQLDVQLVNEKTWGPGDHLTVESKATVFHAPTGTRLGSGEGVCTTRERKYGKRKQERVCPACGVAAIIKGKQEYGGGWVCFKKKNGCGAKYQDADPAITGQDVGEVENPDLPDQWNTVTKMAEKRARVDAVLAVTGASALFTQDVEAPDARADEPPAPATRPASEKQIAYLKSLLKGKSVGDIRWYLRAVGSDDVIVGQVARHIENLPGPVVSALIERLKAGPHPSKEPSDVPSAEPGDFTHPPAEQSLEDAVLAGDVETEEKP